MGDVIKFPTASEEDIVSIEMALIGILLSCPQKIIEVRGIVKPEAFCVVRNRQSYELIRSSASQGLVMDPKILLVSLEDSLFQSSEEKRKYVGDCVSCAITPMQAVSYAKTIMGAWNKRRIRDVASSNATEEEKACEISRLWRSIEDGQSEDCVYSLHSALQKTYNKIDDVYRAGTGFTGLKTGLSDLDKKLSGLDNGGLYVIAARPAMGKTALSVTLATNMAMSGKSVQFFSLEMSCEQISHRIFSRFSRNPIWNQKNGHDVDFIGLMEVKSQASDLKMSIIDKGNVTADWIFAKSTEMSKTQKPDCVFIDHLAIVRARDASTNRTGQITEMTATFKALAKELDCPVVLLHQLNRGTEGREDKRPMLSDLRDSGSVEQDADAVIMIYREEYYLQNKGQNDKDWAKTQERLDVVKGLSELIIAKNRQGEAGIVTVAFDAIRQEFSDLARQQQ